MVANGTGRGTRVERRVFVKAVPRTVWTTLHDPSAAISLYPELRLDAASPGWPAAGSERHGEIRLGLVRTAIRVESTEARPQSVFSLGVAGEGLSIAWRWRLEPLAGGTRVVHDGVVDVSGRWLGLLARIGRDSAGRLAEAHLRGLRDAAEAREREWRASPPSDPAHLPPDRTDPPASNSPTASA
jgi:hypothetical protein